MDDRLLRRGYRNAWILTLLATIFVVGFFLFALRANTPARAEAWDMGGSPFVPASAIGADGYHRPAVGQSRRAAGEWTPGRAMPGPTTDQSSP